MQRKSRSNLDRIASNPEILGGKPIIKGTRIPVYLVIELLSSGMTEAAVLKEYPSLERADIRASLEYASKILSGEAVIPIEVQ
jgi:uncharacterized protein (DUF433 family)